MMMTAKSILAEYRARLVNMAVDAYVATLPEGVCARVRWDGARVVEVKRYSAHCDAYHERREGEHVVHRPRKFVPVEYRDDA